MFHLRGFLCGKHKENCLVKITEEKAQVKRFLLHFPDAKNLLKMGEAEYSGPFGAEAKGIINYSESIGVSPCLTPRCPDGIIRP